MNVKSAASRGSAGATGAATDAAAQATASPADWADAARQPMAVASQATATATMMKAAEILQQVNLQALQRVALGQQQAAEKLRGAGSVTELMTVQAGLMMTAMSETLQYTQDLATAAMKIQGELMPQQQQQQQQAGMAAPFNANMTAMAAPMVQAWQTFFRAPLNGSAAAQSH